MRELKKYKPYLWGFVILGLLTLGFILRECRVEGATKIWGIALIIFIVRALPTILRGAKETKLEKKSVIQYFLEAIQLLLLITGSISWIVGGKWTAAMFTGVILLGVITWIMEPITISRTTRK